MASTRFYLDSRKTREGQPAILKLAIAHRHQTILISLDVRLLPSQWDSDKLTIRNHPDKQLLTTYFDQVKNTVSTLLLELTRTGELNRLSSKELKAMIEDTLHPTKKQQTDESLFLPRFKKFVEPKKESTKEVYEHTLNRVRAYIDDDALNALKFEEITLDWLHDFNAFMTKTSPSPNARNIHFRNLRAVFNNAIENEVTTHYSFRKFKIKAVDTAKRSLSVEELGRLFYFPCEEHQKKYLDMFRLSFYLMGVNMIDLVKLTEIVNGRLEFNRTKTGHLYSMKVEPEAMELFEKYKGVNYLLFVLDHWTNDEFFRRKMNKQLKKIGPMHKKPGRGGKKIYEPMYP